MHGFKNWTNRLNRLDREPNPSLVQVLLKLGKKKESSIQLGTRPVQLVTLS